MNPEPLPDDVAVDARWLVQAIDPRARLARLIDMDEAAYRDASFLDDRIMVGGPAARLVALDPLFEAGQAMTVDTAGWIFHVGHVGSTLVSRLLGALSGVLAVREPRSLRDLTMLDAGDIPYAGLAVRRLMARTFAPGDCAIVKATSFVSEIAPHLIGPEARALFLYASPANYVASILAGPNSTIELQALEGSRRQRLAARAVTIDALPTNAHRAAAAWLCEMLSLSAAAEGIGDRAAWFDFDQMLTDMPEALSRSASHFGLSPDHDVVRSIAEGPLMRRYSKAMEYDYSPDLRRDLLNEARWNHGRDIEQALAWLHDQLDRHPVAAPLRARLA